MVRLEPRVRARDQRRVVAHPPLELVAQADHEPAQRGGPGRRARDRARDVVHPRHVADLGGPRVWLHVIAVPGRLHDDAEVVGFALRELHVDGRDDDGLAHLGPDLLGPGWDAERAVANLAAAVERDPGLTVSAALLDQRIMAGVGNIYRNEICFLLGAHPSTPIADVDTQKAVALARELLWDNRLRPIRNTTGLPGRANHWVYGRENRPCRRCGTASPSTARP